MILWPCDGLAYSRTIRSRFWFRQRYLIPIAYSLPMVFLPIWIAYGFYYSWPSKSLGIFFAYVPIGGLVLWLACYLLFVRPLRQPAKQSRERCEQWRDSWRQFEQQSASLKARIVDAGRGNISEPTEEAPIRWVPRMPPVSVNLSNRREIQIGTITLPDDVDTAVKSRELAEAVLSYMLIEMVACGGQSVIGIMRFNDQPYLGACFMVSERAQLWALFSVRTTGNTLSMTLETGHQWWVHPCELSDGTNYRGDVTRARLALMLPDSPWAASGAPVFMFLYPMAAIAYGMLAAFAIGAVARELLHRDFQNRMRSRAAVACGDAADYWILAEIRASRKRWTGVQLSDGTLADIETLFRRLYLAAQKASTIQGIVG